QAAAKEPAAPLRIDVEPQLHVVPNGALPGLPGWRLAVLLECTQCEATEPGDRVGVDVTPPRGACSEREEPSLAEWHAQARQYCQLWASEGNAPAHAHGEHIDRSKIHVGTQRPCRCPNPEVNQQRYFVASPALPLD